MSGHDNILSDCAGAVDTGSERHSDMSDLQTGVVRPPAMADEIVQARHRNDAQPISRLPDELVCQIIDGLLSDSAWYSPGQEPANLPQALAVYHRWRVVGISYAKLWSSIEIHMRCDQYSRPVGDFGGFYAKPTATRLHRLAAHLARSRGSPIRLKINMRMLYTPRQEIDQYIDLLSPHAARFEILDVINTHHLSVLPLLRHVRIPRSLRTSSEDAHQLVHCGTSTQLLDGADRVSPVVLTLPSISQPFHLIGAERLDTLEIRGKGSPEDWTNFCRFIQRAPVLRSLVFCGYKESFHHTNAPIFIPTLKFLDVDCRSSPLAPKFLDASTVIHLTARIEDAEPLGPLVGPFYSLLSMVVNDLWGATPPGMETWFVGKRDLVAAEIPDIAAERLDPAKLATNAPELRYLMVTCVYWDTNGSAEECNAAAMMDNIAQILQCLPNLRVLCVHHNTTAPANSAHSRLSHMSGVDIPIIWEIAEAHQRGDEDCFEPYTKEPF